VAPSQRKSRQDKNPRKPSARGAPERAAAAARRRPAPARIREQAAVARKAEEPSPRAETRAVDAGKTSPPAEPPVTLRASRRFWLLTLGSLVLALTLVQAYGYFTGWGDPERLVQRYFKSAQRLTLARRYPAAIHKYEKIIGMTTNPDNRRQALIAMADLLRDRKQWDRASEIYRQLQQQDPTNILSAWAGLQLAQIALEAGRLEQAYRDFETVSRRFPASDWDAEAQMGLGGVREKEERFPEAIARYRRVLAAYPGGFLAAEAWVQIGKCYEHLGDLPAAARAYQEVLDKYPPSTWDEAKARLQRLQSGKEAEGVRLWGGEP